MYKAFRSKTDGITYLTAPKITLRDSTVSPSSVSCTSVAGWEINRLPKSYQQHGHPFPLRHSHFPPRYCPCWELSLLSREYKPSSNATDVPFQASGQLEMTISECIPEYLAAIATNGPIPCPHTCCPAKLHSEPVLWHHLGDAHSTYKSDVGKKRQFLEDEEDGVDMQVETSNTVKTKACL